MSPMPDDEVTLAVLGERLANALTLLGEVREEQRVQGRVLNGVRALTARVDALERWQTWALRTVVGLVIVAGLAASAAYLTPV